MNNDTAKKTTATFIFLSLCLFSMYAQAASQWYRIFPSGSVTPPYINAQACSQELGNCVLMYNQDGAIYSPAGSSSVFELIDPYTGSNFFYPRQMVADTYGYIATSTDYFFDPVTFNYILYPKTLISKDGISWDLYSYLNMSDLYSTGLILGLLNDKNSGKKFLFGAQRANFYLVDIYSSTDGYSWAYDSSIGTINYPFSSGAAIGDVYGNTQLFFTSSSTAVDIYRRILPSTTWQKIPSPPSVSGTLRSIKWNASKHVFVAVGDGSVTPDIFYSQDGYSWTTVPSSALPPLPLQDIAFDDNGLGVAVGHKIALVATDGYSNWVPTPGLTQSFNHVSWDGFQFVASGSNGEIASSTNGQKWTSWNAQTSPDPLFDIAVNTTTSPYASAVVGKNGAILTSTNASFWLDNSIQPNPSTGTTPDFRGITWTGNCFLAVGSELKQIAGQNKIEGTIYYSCDPAGSQSFSSVYYGYLPRDINNIGPSKLNDIAVNKVPGDTYTDTAVAVGENGTIIYLSGINQSPSSYVNQWKQGNDPYTNTLNGVAHGYGRFVAVGTSGLILQSVDGYSWTRRANGLTTNTLNDIKWIPIAGVGMGNGMYIATGYNEILTSMDGSVWNKVTLANAYTLGAIGFDGNSGEIIVGQLYGKGFYTSTDGSAWSKDPYGFPASVNAISSELNSPLALARYDRTIYQRSVDTSPPTIYLPQGLSTWTFGASGSNGLSTNDSLVQQFIHAVYAFDNFDGYIFSRLTNSLSLTTLPIGSTVVDFYAQDRAGNSSSKSVTINIVDQTPPTLIPPANITVVATSALGTEQTNPLISAFLNGYTVSDNVSLPQDINVSVIAPPIFPIGTTDVIFVAQDAALQQTQATAKVTVTSGTAGTVGKAGCLVGSVSGNAIVITLILLVTLLCRRNPASENL